MASDRTSFAPALEPETNHRRRTGDVKINFSAQCRRSKATEGVNKAVVYHCDQDQPGLRPPNTLTCNWPDILMGGAIASPPDLLKEERSTVLSYLSSALSLDIAHARMRDIERQSRRLVDVIEPAPRPIRDQT